LNRPNQNSQTNPSKQEEGKLQQNLPKRKVENAAKPNLSPPNIETLTPQSLTGAATAALPFTTSVQITKYLALSSYIR
jgi:hypothetical protein